VTRALFALLAASIAGVALLRGQEAAGTQAAQTLPYYETRDFTPRWTRVVHRIAPFRLIDQENRPRTEKDLDGKIHVASFLFTECPNVCPALVARLKPVQEALRGQDDVLMVSYSVTPLTDTPAVLAAFGRLRGIDPARWRLLTGDLSEVRNLMSGSYFADDTRVIDGTTESRLLHTEKVLLVDRDRHLRGIYNGTSAFEMQRLVEDIETLRREP
jgi:protein SCO1/2